MGYKKSAIQDFVIQKLDYIIYTVILFVENKDVFTNIELAIIFWVLMLLIFCSILKDISKEINNVIVALAGVIKHIISKIIIVYFFIVTIMFSNLKGWEIIHTKEVILYVIFIYVPMFYTEVHNKQGNTKAIQILKKQFYLSTFFMFIVDLFEVPLIFAIMFVGVWFLIGIILAASKDEILAKILDYVKIIINLYYFSTLIYYADSNINEMNIVVALISYALPIAYTLISIPLIVMLGIFAAYENLFAVLNIRTAKKCKYLLGRKLKLILVLGCNKKKIYFFKDNYIIKIYHGLNEEGFNKVLKDFREQFRKEKHTLIV